jgi:CRISPR system Cascade subunit CasD
MKSSTPLSDERWLVLRLAGPFQSWGLPSRHDNRPTADFPTKSGIVGMLSNAMGIPRDDRAMIATLASLRLSVFKLKDGVLYSDYHTAGGGWDDDDDERRRLVSVEGRSKKDAAITTRQYLVGADYLAVLEGTESIIKRCEQALLRPKNILFLGRKSCLPSEFILESVFDNKEDVVSYLESMGVTDGTEYIEDANSESATDYPMDIPVAFGSSGEYRRRFVKREIWQKELAGELAK